LADEALGQILQYVGLWEAAALFCCGHRILSHKLMSVDAIAHLKHFNEFTMHATSFPRFIRDLKGVQSIRVIYHPDKTSVEPEAFEALPLLENLEVFGIDLLGV
jgi:hypothetical protein